MEGHKAPLSDTLLQSPAALPPPTTLSSLLPTLLPCLPPCLLSVQLVEAAHPHFVHGSGGPAPHMWWKVSALSGHWNWPGVCPFTRPPVHAQAHQSCLPPTHQFTHPPLARSPST